MKKTRQEDDLVTIGRAVDPAIVVADGLSKSDIYRLLKPTDHPPAGSGRTDQVLILFTFILSAEPVEPQKTFQQTRHPQPAKFWRVILTLQKVTYMGACIKRFIVLFLILSVRRPGFARPAFDQGVLRATLANGLRVVIVQNSLAPVVTTEVNYLVGSNEAPDGFPGMAHAQEHMMFRGSPGLSADQLSNIMALMGGDFNAGTQQSVTGYFFTVPKDDLDVALNIEAVRMQGVLDSQELWEQERGAIEQEIAQDLSSPEYVLLTRLMAELFAGTPYAHDALGTRPPSRKQREPC